MKLLLLAVAAAMAAACSTPATYEVVDAGIKDEELMSMPIRQSHTERQAVALLKEGATSVPGKPSLQLLGGRFPGYPEDVLADGIEGIVDLAFTVDEAGRVKDLEVISSPDPRLSAECLGIMGRWRFRPPMKDGAPVSVKARQRFPFRLQ
jgi:TonB family protein